MDAHDTFDSLAEHVQARLVGLCAALTGSPDAADDLAQETLLEAWRVRERLVDPTGADAWLFAIARNVCLRWRRTQGRETSRLAMPGSVFLDGVEIADDIDLELEVERADLESLLDKALNRLPADTRAVLTERYAEDLSVREIATRRGLSEGAVSLRLHRGREALRRILGGGLRGEAEAWGLASTRVVAWQETRMWCPFCGTRRLQVCRDPAARSFAARCAGCRVHWTDNSAEYLDEVKGPWRTVLRMNRESHRYFRGALRDGHALCACCGRRAAVTAALPSDLPGEGVHVRCETCEAISYQPRIGLVLTLPEVGAFWRAQRRIRLAREQAVERSGRAAIVTTLESVSGGAKLDVVSDAETFAVMVIHGGPDKERNIA